MDARERQETRTVERREVETPEEGERETQGRDQREIWRPGRDERETSRRPGEEATQHTWEHGEPCGSRPLPLCSLFGIPHRSRARRARDSVLYDFNV